MLQTQKFNGWRIAVVAAALGIGAVGANPAHASLISIGLQQAGVNGGAITTVATDAASPGSVGYIGAYGTFSTNNISAVGAPAMPTGSIDTNSIQVSSTSAGTLNVYVTEQGLTSPLGVQNWLSSFTSNIFGGAAKSVAETTFLSASNQLYAGTQIGTASFSGLGTSYTTTASPNLLDPYSETTMYAITVGAGFSNVNDTIDISPVPEPMTLSLLAGSLLALGVARKRFA